MRDTKRRTSRRSRRRQEEKQSIWQNLFIGFVSTIAVAALLYFSFKDFAKSQEKPVVQRIIVGLLDNSKSIGDTPEAQRLAKQQQLGLLGGLVRTFPHGTTRVVVASMASETVERYNATPKSPTGLRKAIETIAAEPTDPVRGTYFAKANTYLSEKLLPSLAKQFPGVPVAVVFLGDGGVDDQAKAKVAADKLTTFPDLVAVGAAPVRDDQRPRMLYVYGGVAGQGKFACVGSLDSSELFDHVVGALKDATAENVR
jgi:hypothetical protein